MLRRRRSRPDATGLGRWRAVGYDDGASHTDFGISRLEAGRRDPHAPALLRGVLPRARGRGRPRRPPRRRSDSSPATTACCRSACRTRGTRPRSRRRGPMCSRRRRARSTDRTPIACPTRHRQRRRRVDPRDPRTRSFGNITADHMNPGRQSQELLAVSASMRTALLVYSGISLKMMVDSDLGAVLHTMFMVQYEPDGVAGPHDHPLEEAYLITRRRGRRDVRRRGVPTAGRRHRVGGRRLRPLLPRDRRAGALGRDPVAADARPARLSLRPRLGLSGDRTGGCRP